MAYTTIDDSTAHFNTSLYTGTGAANSIIGTGFQPDLVWLKDRGATNSHRLVDSSRGVQEALRSNATSAEGTDTGLVTAFNSDGFSHNSSDTAWNGSGDNYVAWQWKANGGTRVTFTESGDNPAGGYQANTTAGFSIVDYVGTGGAGTVAHGLGVAPYFIIIKARDGSDSNEHWRVGHNSMAWTHRMQLNETEAKTDSDTCFNDTAPTSSVFTIGTDNKINTNDENMIAYCFAPIQGYSKFGSYEGNGNADGTFVYTGFKPAFLLYKNADDDARNWSMNDTKRSTYNTMDDYLLPNLAIAEGTSDAVDFLSNGFKLRSSDAGSNDTNETIIYMAFAEEPFVTSTGIPATAR